MANPTILAPQVESELLKTIDKFGSVDEDQVNQSCFLQSSEFFRAAIADVMEEVLGLSLEQLEEVGRECLVLLEGVTGELLGEEVAAEHGVLSSVRQQTIIKVANITQIIIIKINAICIKLPAFTSCRPANFTPRARVAEKWYQRTQVKIVAQAP